MHHFISVQYNFKEKVKNVNDSLILLYVITSVVTITFSKTDVRLLRL